MNAAIVSLTRFFDIKKLSATGVTRVCDAVAAEEPLEIRLTYSFKDLRTLESLAVTMRTPGRDRELVAGFLYSERIVSRREDLLDMRPLGLEPSNEWLVDLASSVDVEAWRVGRRTVVNSSCGICGTRFLNDLPAYESAAFDSYSLSAEDLASMPDRLRDHQAGFDQTGGLHAAILIDEHGSVEAVFEDIGRHNALDKLIGSCLLAGQLPLHRKTLFLSSRSSFELVQKAVLAGAPILATVGAPSSLAIEAARTCGLTLVGFVRDGRANIYAGDSRIHFE